MCNHGTDYPCNDECVERKTPSEEIDAIWATIEKICLSMQKIVDLIEVRLPKKEES